mgnify:CR=1 FL=1
MGKKIDRRVRKTKQQLQDGFIYLRKQKDLKEITVKELCELTDLNRGTFYLHYKDIYDLSEQLEESLFVSFQEVLDKHTITSEYKTIDSPKPLLRDILLLIKDNSEFCTMLLSDTGEIAFVNKLKKLVLDIAFKKCIDLFDFNKKEHFTYSYNFILYGCIGIIESWLLNGLKEDPEEIAELASQMILDGIKLLH